MNGRRLTDGDIVIIESGMFRDRHVVARIVSVGRVMSVVQIMNSAGEWGEPRRRNIQGGPLVYLSSKVNTVAAVSAVQAIDAEYHKAVSRAQIAQRHDLRRLGEPT